MKFGKEIIGKVALVGGNNIGIIEEVDEQTAKVFCGNGVYKNFINDSKFFTFLEADVIETILNFDVSDEFDSKTIYRSKDYVNSSSIIKLSYDNGTFTARMIGTYYYNVSLNFKRSSFTCSCPVEYRCKHQCALIFYLQNLLSCISRHSKFEKAPSEDKSFIVKMLKNIENDFCQETIYPFYDYIKSCNLEEFESAASIAIDEYSNNEYVLKEMMMIIYNFDYKYSTNYSRTWTNAIYKNLNFYNKNSYKSNTSCFYYFLDKYNTTPDLELDDLDYILKSINIKSLYLKEIFNYFIKKHGICKVLDKLNDLRALVSNKQTVEYLKSFLNKDQIREYTLDKPIFELNDDLIDDLELESFLNVAERISTTKLLNFLKKFKSVKKEDLPLYLHYLLIALDGDLYYTNYHEANRCIKALSDSSLICYLGMLKNNDYMLNFDRYASDKSLLTNFKRVFNDFFDVKYKFTLNKSAADTSNLDPLTFCRNCLNLNINIYSKYGYLFETLAFYYNGKNFEPIKDSEITSFYDNFHDLLKEKFSSFVNDENKYIEEFKELAKAYNDRDISEKLEIFNKKNYENLTQTLDKNNKVGVEYYFSDISIKDFTLKLKVGIEKYYVVKNMFSFFANIKDKTFISYGKSLAFNHDIKNFQEKDQEALFYLEDLPTIGYSSNEYCYDTKYLLKLLKTLQNQYIYIENKKFFLELNEIELHFFVDENYVIRSTNVDYKFNIGSAILLIDLKTNVINLAKVNERYPIEFYDLMLNCTNKNIKQNLDKFINYVYTEFGDAIEVSENVKKDFKYSQVNIKSYFDFDSKVIKSKVEYYKNDLPCKNKNNLSTSDKNFINKYNYVLQSLGFDDDNKISDEDQIFNFLTMDFSVLKKYSEVYMSESLMNKKVITFKKPTLKIQHESNLIDVIMQDSEYSDEELYQILKAIKVKKKFVLLKNDSIVDLSTPEATRFLEVVDDLNLDEKELNKPKALPLYDAFKLAKEDNVEFDEYLENVIKDIANFKNYEIALPKLKAKYRTYQIEGFKWLSILTKYSLGGILADDMGLGKSLQIIMLLVSNNVEKPSLIVCPKSLVFNWSNEFEKFESKLKICSIFGASKDRETIINKIKKDKKVIYITSYDSLRNDIDLYNNLDFNFLILDEGQYIKNNEALKSKSVKTIKSDHRFVLTGTPLENSILDLWSIFDFLMPNYFENLHAFRTDFTQKGEDFIKATAIKVSPFILRRTKGDVLKDLPPKFERVITTEMKTSQRKLYDSISLQAKNVLNNDGKAFDVLSIFTRLRQICVHPSTYIDDYDGGSGKIESLKEIVTEYVNNGHKILIFSQFVRALNIVEKELQDLKIKYFKLTGDTSGEDRIKMSNAFNQDNSEEKVFLISLKAGGTGLNLIGADTIIHLDPWWNVAVENQASDRAHRIGQKNNVEVIRLIAENTIEQKVIELQNKKKDLVDKLISDDDSSISKLSLDDIKFILS